jgi:hypothetical protein
VNGGNQKLQLRPFGQKLQLQRAGGGQGKIGVNGNAAEGGLDLELSFGRGSGDDGFQPGAQDKLLDQGGGRVGDGRRQLGRRRDYRRRWRRRRWRRDFGHDAFPGPE